MNQGITARLKVNVRIGTDLRSARIAVLGLVTPVNLPALSVIARRTSALLPGKEIILDLSHARAAAAAQEKLHDPGHLMKLAGEKQEQLPPCTLRVLTPPEATALAHERAYLLPGGQNKSTARRVPLLNDGSQESRSTS